LNNFRLLRAGLAQDGSGEAPKQRVVFVQEGDIIKTTTRSSITITDATGGFDHIEILPDFPYRIPGTEPLNSSSIAKNLRDWAIALLKDAEDTSIARLRTRSPAGSVGFDIPLIDKSVNKIIAGGTTLPISWISDGKETKFRIFSNGRQLAELLIPSDSIGQTGRLENKNATIVLSKPGFQPGFYSLAIEYDGEELLLASNVAYNPFHAPQPIDSANRMLADETVRRVVDALELGSQDNGAWRLEAYRRLNALADRDDLTDLAIEFLAQSKSIPAPPPR
jgi:hypothetical protein